MKILQNNLAQLTYAKDSKKGKFNEKHLLLPASQATLNLFLAIQP
jgi:hypothetical protein